MASGEGGGGYTGGLPNPTNPAQVGGAVGAGVKGVTGLIPGADAANSALDSITAARRWLGDRHNWVRMMWFGLGGALIVTGVVMLAHKPIMTAGQTVTSQADKLAGLGTTAAKVVK